jgi:pimeloyl-ACP methyl ester carboxylesterase
MIAVEMSVFGGSPVTQYPRAAYFGPDARLFGVFDTPTGSRSVERGVVVCYPHGADYHSAFRSLRVFATQLARAGFHVLRFDYLGTGDSLGDDEDASLRQWSADIRSAIDELRARGIRDISLVGLRLGASLAALALRDRGLVSADRVILWEPILDGRTYLEDLRSLHREWIVEERRSGRAISDPGNDELLGVRITPDLRAELERMNASSIAELRGVRARIVWQRSAEHAEALRMTPGEPRDLIDCDLVEGPEIWARGPHMAEPVVPTRVLQSMVHWLEQEAP